MSNALLAAFLLISAPAAQQVTFLLGPAGGPADVAPFDEASGLRLPTPPELAGIELVAIDCTGRTALDALRSDRPRLAADVPGGRVVLPFGNGSLYRYRRVEGAGAAWGFLWIDAGGMPRAVHEVLAPAGQDPWREKVAVAPDGAAFLAATVPSFGGDVVEVELASASAESRTQALGPLDVLPAGLALLPDWGVVLAAGGVLRFDRAPGAQAAAVPLGGFPPAYLGDGIARSDGGTMAALVAGTAASQAWVWGLEASGAAAQLSAAPMPLSGAGHLPEHVGGPTLALSPSADLCLWRTEGAASAEAWVRPIQALAPPPVQVTAAGAFEDTLDSTGEFGFFEDGSAMVLVGEADAAGGTDGGDLYRVVVDAGGSTSITNLSNTSGTQSMPFTKGTLKADAGIWRVPGADALLLHNDLSSNEGQLAVVRPDRIGLSVLRDGVASVHSAALAGADVAVAAESSDGGDELYSVPLALDALSVQASLGAGFRFAGMVPRDDGWLGVLLDVPGGGRWVGRVHLPTASAEVLIEAALPLGSAIGFTPERLGFTVDFTPRRSAGVTWGLDGRFGLYAFGGRPGILLPNL